MQHKLISRKTAPEANGRPQANIPLINQIGPDALILNRYSYGSVEDHVTSIWHRICCLCVALVFVCLFVLGHRQLLPFHCYSVRVCVSVCHCACASLCACMCVCEWVSACVRTCLPAYMCIMPVCVCHVSIHVYRHFWGLHSWNQSIHHCSTFYTHPSIFFSHNFWPWTIDPQIFEKRNWELLVQLSGTWRNYKNTKELLVKTYTSRTTDQ